MRKPNYSILIIATLLFVSFIMGYSLGRSQVKSEIVVSTSRNLTQMPTEAVSVTEQVQNTESAGFPVNINRATKEELTALPGIGDVLAQRILDYRKNNGKFGSAEELLNVEGIGKKKLEEFLNYIVIGG